jgi:hypothetical protein
MNIELREYLCNIAHILYHFPSEGGKIIPVHTHDMASAPMPVVSILATVFRRTDIQNLPAAAARPELGMTAHYFGVGIHIRQRTLTPEGRPGINLFS